MGLPDPPDWKELLDNPMTQQAWAERQFIASGVSGFVVCLKCASLVLSGEQARHDRSLHGFKGF